MQSSSGVFERSLAQLACRIEDLLAEMPESTLEARRLITRELHFEPRPEELQTIVRLAHDEGASGPRRDIPRRLLGVRILADRELKQLNEGLPLDPEWIDRVSDTLPALGRTTREIEDELRTLVDTGALQPADRDYLLQAGDAFVFPREEIVAGGVLAQELARLARAVRDDSLPDVAPSLTERERQHIKRAVLGDEQPAAGDPSRACVDAIAVRTLLERLLAEWDGFPAPDELDATGVSARKALLERLKQARVALDHVTGRLQQQQDMALMAGLVDFAEEIRQTGRGMFSIRLKLAPVLRDPHGGAAVEKQERGIDQESMRELLKESVTGELPVGDQKRRVTKEELYLDALNRDKDTAPQVELPDLGEERVRVERRRLLWMGATASVLAVVSLLVNFVLLPKGADHPDKPSIRRFDTVIDVSRVETAGPMMFTHVDGWNDLDHDTRRSRVEGLGQAVEEDGFRMVFVLDEFGQPVAHYAPNQGTRLLESTPSGP